MRTLQAGAAAAEGGAAAAGAGSADAAAGGGAAAAGGGGAAAGGGGAASGGGGAAAGGGVAAADNGAKPLSPQPFPQVSVYSTEGHWKGEWRAPVRPGMGHSHCNARVSCHSLRVPAVRAALLAVMNHGAQDSEFDARGAARGMLRLETRDPSQRTCAQFFFVLLQVDSSEQLTLFARNSDRMHLMQHPRLVVMAVAHLVLLQ
jgi:hypothetical protein